MDIGIWVAIFMGQLLWYPLARRRPPETRFLENLNFGRWVVFSIFNVGGMLMVYTLMRAIGLFGNG